MSLERVREYFRTFGMEGRVWEFDTSSATVQLAAEALGVRPARIAKTLSFALDGGCVLVVAAGDARVDNRKFKDGFGTKAKMLALDEVERLTGSEVGGVCPFALPEETPVYLDESLKRFATVFPACGSTNSAIELTCAELLRFSRAKGWVDVCKDWEAGGDPVIDDVPNPERAMPSDGEIGLRVCSVSDADEKKGFVPMYSFDIVRMGDGAVLGKTDLRLGYVRNLYYGGNIGYAVLEEYRGNAYAQKAVRLVFEVARAHGMPYVIISCSEENAPSRRTLEHLGGTLLETGVPPTYTALYQRGDHGRNCIFRFDLN
ncbi:MAG: GNAT family N-acetyltransferase [Clostridiales bacterium]|nr:GNAT family N-acetyltransferase [Clostridiales bacterium]